jgi:hypothetical protein
MVAGTSGDFDKLAWVPASAATSRAMPVSDRQSARFGVSLSVKLVVVEIEIVTDRLPNRRIGRQDQQTGGLFGDTEFLGRAQHARGLDAAHLGELDNEIAGQLGTGQGARHAQADGNIRRTADDGRRRRAGIDLADIETVGIGMLDDFEHLRDDDVVELGRDRLQTSSTSRPAMVSRWESSSLDSFGSTRVRSQDSENFMRIASGNAGRLQRKGAGH